jgi:predicted nucleic acid-binding protein
MKTLIDAGPIVAYYDARDDWHTTTEKFFENFRGQYVTTCAVVTEALYLLNIDHRVANEFLRDLSNGLYSVEPLLTTDYARIAVLNQQYANVPTDFADLSLVAVAERLQLIDIVSLDSDFEIYRSHGKKTFNQLFPKHKKR